MTLELSNSTEGPKLAVIVPVYKVEKYLPKCLDSIINQTYKNLQIICVDDGSPDNCGAILDEYAKKDSRVIVIHKENGGVSSARNTALDLLKENFDKEPYNLSKYVTFIDSDDFIDKFTYEKLIPLFENGVDVVCFGYEKIYEDRKYTDRDKYIQPNTESQRGKHKITNQIIKYTHGVVRDKIFKTDIILKENIRFKNRLVREDELFCIKYMFHSSFIWYEVNYYYKYLIRESSATGSHNIVKKGVAIEELRSSIDLLEYLRQNDLFISRNEVFWASFYDSVINAINHAPKEEHQSIYIEAQKIIANNPKCNPTPFQLHIDQLVTVSDLSEQNKVLYRGLVMIKHRSNYDKYYVLGVPIFKTTYSEECKSLSILGLLRFKLRY